VPEHVYETDVVRENLWEELKLHSFWQKAAFVVAICGTLSCLLTMLGEAIRATRAPLKPDASHGIVVPFNNHGEIHYISHSHSVWLNLSTDLYPMFLGALIILVASSKWRATRS
jgi:hypothetical protein